jgi:hypothetical protein
MELNFDKEIDAILRKAQPVSSAAADGLNPAHLDADEISAFAENALPENAKMRCTAHLADCERCRKILSNLILLAAEPSSEIVHAEEIAAAIPWHRKLFIFPNFVYSLGALAIVFGSLILVTVLQSLDKNADVSRVSNKASAPAAANANVSAAASNTMAPANTSANSTANFGGEEPATNTRSNLMPMASNPNAPRDEVSQPAKDSDLAQNKPFSIDGASGAGQVKEDQKRADTDKKNTDDEKLKTEREMPSAALGDTATTKQAKRKIQEKEGETTSVGGKTFRRVGSAWVDSAYQSGSNMMLPSLTYVSRGSSDYRKLDGDLKRIAEKLSGVVIVLWKSKAYRIQ